MESRKYSLSGKFAVVPSRPGKQLGGVMDGTQGCEGAGGEAVVAP